MAGISHDDVKALIEKEVLPEIVKSSVEKSQAFSLLTRLRDMNSSELELKVEKSLPLAYFQATPTSTKKLSNMSWENVTLKAEEIAVIIPISEADLRDTKYDLVGNVKTRVEEAIANKVDGAIFFGVDKPTSFPAGIVSQAITKGYAVEVDPTKKLYDQISDAMGYVEDDNYEVTGIVGGPSIKKVFRGLTDTTGQLITGDEISALPRAIVRNGAWDNDVAKLVVGDFKQAVYSIRQDVEVKVLTEGVIQDPTSKAILHNLAQDDMIALRFTFRFAWGLPTPVSRVGGDSRLPFAALVPAEEANE